MLAQIIGPDILVLIAVIALLFGGTQIPKLARSLGRAQKDFKQGLEEGESLEPPKKTKPSKSALERPPGPEAPPS